MIDFNIYDYFLWNFSVSWAQHYSTQPTGEPTPQALFRFCKNLACYHFLLWTFEQCCLLSFFTLNISISEMESILLKICEQQLFQFGWIDVTEGQFVVMAVMLVTAAEGFFDVNIWNSPVIIFILNTAIMIIIIIIVVFKETSPSSSSF